MKQNEKIIIFGAGQRLRKLEKDGVLDDFEIVAICDNDVSKQGKYFNYCEIVDPNRINEFSYEEVYISSNEYYHAMREQLITELGIASNLIKRFVSVIEKQEWELNSWKNLYKTNKDCFDKAPTEYYKDLMLAIASEDNDEFLQGKVVADFGCGPRGSLAWTDMPQTKIGIDVLATKYLEEFGEEMISHNMIYVVSTEEKIPVPSGYVDYLFTLNALDYVLDLDKMIKELLRILKPGGTLIGSFNLNEGFTVCEPQTLTEIKLKEKLLKYFEIESYRLAYAVEPERRFEDFYGNFKDGNLVKELDNNKEAILWVRGKRKSEILS